MDQENTKHYDYSALLYLTNYAEHFEGGYFEFLDEDMLSVVEPRRGRFMTFNSRAIRHRFTQVTSGNRVCFSTWWTCEERYLQKEGENNLYAPVLEEEL